MNFAVDWRERCIVTLTEATKTATPKQKKAFEQNIYVIKRFIEYNKTLQTSSVAKIQEFIDAYKSLLTKEGLFDNPNLSYALIQIHNKINELSRLKQDRQGHLKEFLPGSDFLAAAEAFDRLSS